MKQSLKHTLIKSAPIFLALAAILACGSDSTAPTATIAGSYSASQFLTTGSSGQTNQILAGSTLVLTLSANHTLAGHLHLAATNANSLLDADMAGTWTQTGNTASLTSAADTFVNDMTFNVVANGNLWQLVGDQVISGTRIQIALDQLATL